MTVDNRRENGFAVVYGLVVLLLVTVGGTSLLFLAQKDHSTVSDYVKMRSATLAAKTAIKACEGQLYGDSEGALAILKKFKEDPSYCWMFGTADDAGSENKIQLWNDKNAPRFSARLLGFDDANMLVQIEGMGYGRYGGKRRSIASMYLGGIGKVTKSSGGATYNAIYIRKDGENLNKPLTINGNVYMGGKFRLQPTGGIITINGNFKSGTGSELAEVLKGMLINGNALFQCPVHFEGVAVEINGNAGFDKYMATAINYTIRGDAFFNSTINANGYSVAIDMTGHKVTHSGSANTTYLNNASQIINKGSTINLEEEIGICAGDEEPVTLDLTVIPEEKIFNFVDLFGLWQSFSGKNMNKAYYADPNRLWNGFLVIRIPAASGPFYNYGNFDKVEGTFTGKTIIIVEEKLTIDQKWYDCDPSSITVFHVSGNGSLYPFGWRNLFRGYLYLTDGGYCQFSQQDGAEFVGCINFASISTELEWNGNHLPITYDDALMQELLDIGLAQAPKSCFSEGSGSSSGSSEEGELILVDTRIRPEVLNLQL